MVLGVLLTSILLTPVIQDIRAMESDFYQCVPGISDNPGGDSNQLCRCINICPFPVTYPRGDIFHLVGTDNANGVMYLPWNGVELYCHLNPYHSYFKKGYSSKDLFFDIKGRGMEQKMTMEKSIMETEILNDTSIRSTFYPPEVAGIYDVR